MLTNELILTVGLPRSGKSTWARGTGYPIVSPDAVRLAMHGRRFWGPAEHTVWATCWTMVAALFHAGHKHVIVDACHNTKKRRDFWDTPGMGDHPDWPGWVVSYKVFRTSLAECLRRAADDFEIIPVIDRMAQEAEWPVEMDLMNALSLEQDPRQ